MPLDIWGREDVRNILDSIEAMGGELFTLNAVRRAFGISIHADPVVEGRARLLEMTKDPLDDSDLHTLDMARYVWTRGQHERR